VRITCTRLYRQ